MSTFQRCLEFAEGMRKGLADTGNATPKEVEMCVQGFWLGAYYAAGLNNDPEAKVMYNHGKAQTSIMDQFK